MRFRRHVLPDLPAAVGWLRSAWSVRDVPTRLHDRETGDDGAPRYSPAFSRYVSATAFDRMHGHGKLDPGTVDECEWRYPTWRAMVLLGRDHRASHDLVVTFIINAFSIPDMALLGYAPDAILQAIRQLHGRHERRPQRTSWVDKSDSQRAAEAIEPGGAIRYAAAT